MHLTNPLFLSLLFLNLTDTSLLQATPVSMEPPPDRLQHSFCRMVSLLMIGIAAWGKWFGLVSSFQVVGGVIGVGVFLFFVALAGLIGAMKHHQVLLFFYMIVLFMVFIVQFSVSSACLAINTEQQDRLLEVGWNNSQGTQRDVEKSLNCCGFKQVEPSLICDAACFHNRSCLPCAEKIQEHAGEVLHFVGGIGFFFSFTEILGVWLTYRTGTRKTPEPTPVLSCEAAAGRGLNLQPPD
ncbi:tetraspanin-13b isoform X2 [Pseudoliparis swirei]|uniref:tetraspanin-13b isoform X2 n=1 Tax=Pseudoliparis swirei TaxID=2059687 RepID=UPI0024BE1A79|nr:tetraspanin-13b isoform X2 [Pseudoliparis swirei]